MAKSLKRLLLVVVISAAAMITLGMFINEERPNGESGPAADALAQTMERAVDREAWEKTRALAWTFAGGHEYLWDRDRDFVRLKWGKKLALLRTSYMTGRAWKNDQEVFGKERDTMLERAWKLWINDSFWLNPVVKTFDSGVERSLVKLDDGREGLLMTFTTGGATPGDAYLWLPDENGLPYEWKMWVGIIPIGGITNSWERWVQLDTGAKISKRHGNQWFGVNLIEEAKGAATLKALEPGADPFAAIIAPH